MIKYDAGAWAVSYIFNLRLWKGSVMPRALVWALLCAATSYGVCEFMGKDKHKLAAYFRHDATLLWGTHSFILGSVMVFRINQAYSRYWECVTGMLQVKSKWFNAVSNSFAFCNQSESKAEEVGAYQHILVRLTSMLYCAALRQLEEKDYDLEIINNEGMDLESLKFLDSADDQCEVLLQWIQKLTHTAASNGVLTAPPPLLTRVFSDLGEGMFQLCNVRKVRDTPFPYPYAHMVSMFLLIHCLITVLASAFMLDLKYLAATACFVSVFAYSCAYYLALEIERPFGNNKNDVPSAAYIKTMNRSLHTLLYDRAQQPPEMSFRFVKSVLTVRSVRSFSTAEARPTKKSRRKGRVQSSEAGFCCANPDSGMFRQASTNHQDGVALLMPSPAESEGFDCVETSQRSWSSSSTTIAASQAAAPLVYPPEELPEHQRRSRRNFLVIPSANCRLIDSQFQVPAMPRRKRLMRAATLLDITRATSRGITSLGATGRPRRHAKSERRAPGCCRRLFRMGEGEASSDFASESTGHEHTDTSSDGGSDEAYEASPRSSPAWTAMDDSH